MIEYLDNLIISLGIDPIKTGTMIAMLITAALFGGKSE